MIWELFCVASRRIIDRERKGVQMKTNKRFIYSGLIIILVVIFILMAFPLLTGEITDETNETEEVDLYSFIFEDQVLTIKQDLSAEDLYASFGKPISEVIEEVDDGGDTYQGAVVHSLTYEGITIYLFSPQKEPAAFWLMSMTATGSAIHTPQQIAVGSTLEELRSAYPGLEELPPDFAKEGNPQYYVVQEVEAMKVLQFKVLDNQVSQIITYVEMN